jgi:diguanylate cyclase (GGDEF)-like protein/PAS domain S-box-containing protein
MKPTNGTNTSSTLEVLDRAFLSLTADNTLWDIPLDQALHRVTETVAKALKTDRASIWNMVRTPQSIELMDLYDAQNKQHSAGAQLMASDYPGYFMALQNGRVIDAMDATQDHRTREFTEDYLKPLGIGAMLDATLWVAGETRGVLCIEHVGSPRLWTENEKGFAVSVADLIAQIIVYGKTRESESRYEGILNNMPAVAYRCACDEHWSVEYISGGILALSGYDREEFINNKIRTYESIIHPDDSAMVETMVLDKVKKDKPYVLEYRICHKNGDIRWVHEHGRATISESGEPLHLDGVITDITSRRIAESKIKELSAKQKAILNASNYSIITTDLEGTITGFNKASERMLGYQASEMIGKATPALIHDINEVADRARELSKELDQEVKPGFDVFVIKPRLSGKAEEREWTYIRKDGTRYPCLLSVTSIHAADGTHFGYLGVGIDISEPKNSQLALETSRQQLAQAQAIAHLGNWNLDLLTGKASWSDEEYRLLGYVPGSVEPSSDNFIAAVHPDDRESVWKSMQASMNPDSSGTYEITHRVLLSDQTERILLEKGEVTFDDKGTPLQMFGTTLDITERIRSEEIIRDSESRYRALFEASGDTIFVLRDYRFVDCNEQALKTFGCAYEQIVGETPVRFSPEFQPDGKPSREKAHQKIQAALNGETQHFEWRHLRYDGTPFDAEVTLTHVEINGKPNLLASVRDITLRKKAEAALKESREQLLERNESLRLINQLSSELHGELDVHTIAAKSINTLISIQNPPQVAFYLLDPIEHMLRLQAHSGFDEETVSAGELIPVENSLSGAALESGEILFSSNIEQDDRIYPDMKEQLQRTGYQTAVVIPLIFNQRPLGSVIMVFKEKHPFLDSELNTLSAIGTTISLAISNARQLREFEFQAQHDTLTGLANRSLLHKYFSKQVLNRKNGTSKISALLLMDLDRFKDVNDTLGHHIGDLLLRQISLRLKAILGERSGLVARLGGDEFTVLLTDIDGLDEVQLVCTEIQHDIRQPFVINNMSLEVGASIGIATYPRDGKDSHELLRSADVAMYQSKTNNTEYEFYDQTQDRHSVERLAIMNDLNMAIRENQFVLHYQPKIDIRTRELIGFEALVRWQHPEIGLIMPNDFIPFAEISDSIFRLTEHVVDMALNQQKIWRDQGKNYSVAVNLSARSLHDSQCLVTLQETLSKYGSDPRLLELEITETMLMKDPEHAITILSQLSEIGIQLSVDDFGTGYSSLSYLKRLPINALKIDRTFVKDMVENEQDRIIVQSTIGLAQNLGLRVIAEGVEDEDSLQHLNEMACDQAQGYHICRPLPWDKLAEWIEYHESWKH